MLAVLSSWAQLSLQPANSFLSLELIHFFDRINSFLTAILWIIIWVTLSTIWNNITSLFPPTRHFIEIIWIISPTIILLEISIPSLAILYIADDLIDSSLRLKVNAHQWFWRYEYTDFYSPQNLASLEFDAYMLPENALRTTEFRLLETENRPVLPYSRTTQVLISSVDVLHSWTIPRIGIKADANPGRVNHVRLKPHVPGVFYGQCSEICGSNHRFMPICLEFTSAETFMSWIVFNSGRDELIEY